jgi:alcohol dehydrogenase class IV
MGFEYCLPVNVSFGACHTDLVGTKASALGSRALIVTGGSSTKRSGLLDRVTALLAASGVDSLVFDQVSPNPTTEVAYAGAALANDHHCDLVIGVGGGSSIDAAKAIAFQAVNGGNLDDYIFGRAISDRALPLIAIPTTCGTGSEGNSFAVLTNPETLDKKALRSAAIVPACSIVDPALMTTMPKRTLAAVGFDALNHCLEAYLANNSQPLTEIQALHGLKLASTSLRRTYADPSDTEAWEQLSLASLLGGMVIGVAGVAAIHAMEHPVSGLRDAVHGEGLAALTLSVTAHTLTASPAKYGVLAQAISGNPKADILEELSRLREEIGLDLGLTDLGVTNSDVEWLAQNCVKVSAAALANHPKLFDRGELEQIYAEAL